MLIFLGLIFCVGLSEPLHVTKISAEVTVLDAELSKNEPLHLQGVKKINKAAIEHVILRNCSGIIDETTFKHFSKLSKITIWKSNIEQVSTTLSITHLIVIGSHFPYLNGDLQEKLPKLQALMLLGNKHFEVDPKVLKNFVHLRALHVSEANFTESCITKEWFRGMTYLQELGLSDNGIHCVAEDAFNDLRNLRKLDLTYNRIPDLAKKTFKKLTKLEALGLYENVMERLEPTSLANQRIHLEMLGISWNVLKNGNVMAEDILKILPKLKSLSFGHNDMPNDFKAGEFCQILRQKGVSCEVDSVFGVSRILGYSMLP